MLEKIRPNVLFLGFLGAAITAAFGVMLIMRMESIVSNEVLALIVGIGIGSLFTIASQVAQDPPPPTVPAGVHERLMANTVMCACVCDEKEDE